MTHEEKLRELSAVAAKVLPKGGEAWLFGSRARGTARTDSDWDVLVLLDKDSLLHTDYGQFAHPFTEAGWDFGDAVIPILLTKKDWEASNFTPFYKNVTNDRIAL